MFYRVATVVTEVDEKHGYDEDDIRKLTIQNDCQSGVRAKFTDSDERRERTGPVLFYQLATPWKNS